MHDNATRTNHCPDCGTQIHWQAKRCKPCKAKAHSKAKHERIKADPELHARVRELARASDRKRRQNPERQAKQREYHVAFTQRNPDYGQRYVGTYKPKPKQIWHCPECGDVVPTTRTAATCSDLCSDVRYFRRYMEASARLSEAKHGPITYGTCNQCGHLFLTRERLLSQRRYCSKGCARKNNRREREHRLRAARPADRREWISIRIVGERDGWRCHICKKKINPNTKTLALMPSLDHLNPLSTEEGTHALDNLSIAHHRCNTIRGAGRLPAQLRLIA